MYIKQIDKDPELQSIVNGWWKAHSFTEIPVPMLPRTGYIVYEKGKPLLAGYLYLPDPAAEVSMAWVEWVVSNPDSTKEERDEAFKKFFKQIETVCLANGINVLFSAAHADKGYDKRLVKEGWIHGDSNMTHYIKPIVDEG